MLAIAATILAAASLCDVVSASIYPVTSPLTGHDFDFTATYPSGLKLTTSNPPKGILPATEFTDHCPQITLTDPDRAGREDRYISFLEISHIPDPEYDVLNVSYWFPWVKTNLTVTDNGTLSDALEESLNIYLVQAIETSEVRNATLHVWKQTPGLMEFIDDDKLPLLWQVLRVWANVTDNVDRTFPRANVDFKIRNETGEFRGGVDDNGASIPGYVPTSTRSATAKPTSATPTTTGSGSAPKSTATSAGGQTTPHTAASPQAMSASWATAISGILLALVISAI
ncbi:hypothetical protein F5Y05DRAFT_414899 [Hypoxylon sp. FL0543]|nr:hypothetical protein F5Y05DRAFT_414899 [Hypoxylon sp. FL0543]